MWGTRTSILSANSLRTLAEWTPKCALWLPIREWLPRWFGLAWGRALWALTRCASFGGLCVTTGPRGRGFRNLGG